LPEKLHKAFGALGHGNCFGGIFLQNLGTHEVLAKAFQCGEVLADACGREFLLDLKFPNKILDAHFGECFEWSVVGKCCKVFFKRFSVCIDSPFGIPALCLQVYQKILDVFV